MTFRLPLSVVLGLQVIVVAAAFTSVILVLSEQQRKEFQDSLHQQLSLRQSYVMQSVTGPLLSRMEAFDFAISSYTAGIGGSGRFPAPSDDPATSDLESSLSFYNHFYVYPYTDPSFLIISLSNQSRRVFAPYINTSRPTTWNLWVLDNQKLVSIGENEKASVCFKSFPIRSPVASSCSFILQMDYNTATTVGSEYELLQSRRVLTISTLVDDPTVEGGKSNVVTFSVSFPWKPQVIASAKDLEDHLLVFGASISVKHIKPLVLAQTTLPSSTSAVFTYKHIVEDGTHDYYFLTGRVSFPDFDPKVLNDTKSSTAAAWRGGRSPDAVLNKVFTKAVGLLVNQTGSSVFEVSHGGRRYVAAVGRVYEPYYDMNWLLLEYTPREDFFRSSDRARATGMSIGTVGGIVVLVVCLLVWLAVQLPLRKLSGTMLLAADMRNDEVVYNEPILSEIGVLNDAFRDMNNKLLAARPFLPQSLLRAGGSSGDDEDEEEYLEGDKTNTDTESNTQMFEGSRSRRDPLSFSLGSSVFNDKNNSTDKQAKTPVNNRKGMTEESEGDSPLTKKDGWKIVAGGVSHHGSSPHRNINHRQLTFRRVSVLSINVLGFGDTFPTPSEAMPSITARVGRLSHLHAALTRLIESTVGEERGIVDYFHGDRYVCGFNTARVCGNSTRNGAECAAKIWDRFLAYSSSSVESGANAAGRTKVSYPGDDLLALKDHPGANNNNNTFFNIDGRNNELLAAFPCGLAMGLGAGRSLVGNHGTDTMQRLATIGGAYSEAMRLQDVMSRKILFPSRGERQGPTADLPPLFPAGRCLIMGRVIDDLEASSVYCQVLGGIDAYELLGSRFAMDEVKVSAFVRGKNKSSLLRSAASAVVADDDVAAPAVPPPQKSKKRLRSVLVAAVVSSESIRKALEDELLLDGSNIIASPRGGGGKGAVNKAGQQQSEQETLQHQTVVPKFDNLSFSLPMRVEADAGKPKPSGHGLGGADTIGDEWLYELENDKSRNPFSLANLELYRLWNASENGVSCAPHAADVGGIGNGSSVVPPSLVAVVRAVERRSATVKQIALSPSNISPRNTSREPMHARGIDLGKLSAEAGSAPRPVPLIGATTDASEEEHTHFSLPNCSLPNTHATDNPDLANSVMRQAQCEADTDDTRRHKVGQVASQQAPAQLHSGMPTSAPVSCWSIGKWLHFLSYILAGSADRSVVGCLPLPSPIHGKDPETSANVIIDALSY